MNAESLDRTHSLGSPQREAGNYELPAHPGLIVKDSYWRWPERNLGTTLHLKGGWFSPANSWLLLPAN
jgi:hypothetical protein